MTPKKNILWIMADQLRWDYLSCYGHPVLQTPNIDALAARGVRFTNAYVNSPVCGPSRMSFYTGRHVSSHGSTWNGVPLRVGEPTLGDHLRPLGYRVALAGKTHMRPDVEGFRRLGLTPGKPETVFARECGFEPWVRHDAAAPDKLAKPDSDYNAWLRARGYPGDNPGNAFANQGRDADGNIVDGWFMRNARTAAAIPAEHSETAFLTERAMEFVDDAGDQPWCLHLSYIRPHWPYIAPAPYNDMFGSGDVPPANRSEAERADPHPVVAAYMRHPESESFSRDEVRETVIPVYMGLIKQLDDELGRLFRFLDERGLTDSTLIVMSSDHGDYLGDHWLGEKELFHDESAKVPLIVVDPSAEADARRGTACDSLVQAIDLVPTFVDIAGGPRLDHVLEGRSLLPVLRDGAEDRPFVVSEIDYGHRAAAALLDQPPARSMAWMVRSPGWKYIHYEGFRPQLFDLRHDPQEQTDLGEDPAHAEVRAAHRDMLFDWFRGLRPRITMSDQDVTARRGGAIRNMGIIIGEW